MTDSTTPLPPAGWYADPEGGHTPRFWDGTAWAAPSTPAATAAIPSHVPVQSAVSPVDVETNLWHIRLLALLPLLALPGILIFDVSLLVPTFTDTSITSQLAIYLSPGYLLMLAGGWIAFLASIPLAYFDHKSLSQQGVVRPFHWAFVFIGGFVYIIGRTVVVRSRTGKGLFPLWLAIAVQLSVIIATIVLSVNMMTTMMNAISSSF